MLVLLYPTISFLLFLYFKRRNAEWQFAFPFACILLFMSFFCPFFYFHPQFKVSTHGGILSLFPILYWFSIIFIVLLPLKGLNLAKFRLKAVSIDKLIKLSWFLILLSTVSTLLYFPHIHNGFDPINFELNKAITQSGELVITKNRVFQSILNMHSTFRSLVSFTFFYVVCFVSNHRFLKMALGISAILPILFMTFAKCVRVDTAFLAIQLFLLYFLFRDHLPVRAKKNLSVLGILILIVVISLMILFSLLRFNNSHWDWNPSFYLYSYLSESIINFNTLLFGNLNRMTYGDLNFPLIRSYLGYSYSQSSANFKDSYIHLFLFPSWFFYNFVGEIMRDFGKIGAILFFSLLSFFVRKRLVKVHEKSITFIRLFLIFLYVDFISTGLFYNRYSGYFGNLTLQNLLMFIVVLYVYFNSNMSCLNRWKK